MKRIPTEKRLYPRVEQELPIKVQANGYDFATATQNVSCVGTYCHVAKYIPPFTKVLIRLNLPVATAEGKKNYGVECHGVIVRTEDEARGGFNIAIFFNQIREDQRKKISEYVSQFLPHDSSALKR